MGRRAARENRAAGRAGVDLAAWGPSSVMPAYSPHGSHKPVSPLLHFWDFCEPVDRLSAQGYTAGKRFKPRIPCRRFPVLPGIHRGQ